MSAVDSNTTIELVDIEIVFKGGLAYVVNDVYAGHSSSFEKLLFDCNTKKLMVSLHAGKTSLSIFPDSVLYIHKRPSYASVGVHNHTISMAGVSGPHLHKIIDKDKYITTDIDLMEQVTLFLPNLTRVD